MLTAAQMNITVFELRMECLVSTTEELLERKVAAPV
jgi:hypothetical protein